jgi:hypothetical protein
MSIFHTNLESDRAYYLSDVVDIKAIVPNRTRAVIHSPVGSGKSHFLKQLQDAYPIDMFTYMFIYKNDLLDQFVNKKNEYEAKLGIRESVRSHRDVTRKLRAKKVFIYTTVLFEVFLNLVTDADRFLKSSNRNSEASEAIRLALQDRIVVNDEADFLINIIHAVSSAASSKQKEIDINTEILIEATRKFYEEIDKHAKAVIFLTATLQEHWISILPSTFEVIEPPYLMKSINLRKAVIVPVGEWVTNDHTLTSTIVYEIIASGGYNKALIYAPGINLRALKGLSRAPGKRIAVVANVDKITDAALKVIKANDNITLITFTAGTEDDLDSKLNDELVKAHDYIFITNSNCRGISLVHPYGNVCVITIAPIGSETIQASGRFRVPDIKFITEDTEQTTIVDLYMLDRRADKINNLQDFEAKKEELTTRYSSVNEVTNRECYDIEFTLKNSSYGTVETYVERKYIDTNYVFNLAAIPVEIRTSAKGKAVGAAVSSETISKREGLLAFSKSTQEKHTFTHYQRFCAENNFIEIARITFQKNIKELMK